MCVPKSKIDYRRKPHMNSTMEILERISKNSQNNPEEIFTRVYRYMLREDIYFAAYKNLYANNGASTKGIDEDTADGFSEEYISFIIDSLKNGIYSPKPTRRVYIPKTNGKMCPISVPTFKDKYVLLIGIKGDKNNCEVIKQKLAEFISNELKMELSAEKALITHGFSIMIFVYALITRRNVQKTERKSEH